MADSREQRKQRRADAKAKYKERTQMIKELSRNEDPLKIQEVITEELEISNELYPIVKKKLDGTAADSRHIKELLNLCQEGSKRINASASATLDWKRIVIALKQEAKEETGDKTISGYRRYICEKYVNTFLLRPPTFEFMYGALRSEGMVIKERKERKPKEKITETKAVTAKEKDIEIDVEQDSTPKEVEYINKQIVHLAKKKKSKDEGIPFFETVVDPNSFIQTVENIFHVSFLVKEGHIGVKREGRSKKPIITVEDKKNSSTSNQNQEVEQDPAGNQSILSFSMDDYKNWISKYNIKERSFPPRTNDNSNANPRFVQNEEDDDDTEEDDDDNSDISVI